MSNERVYAWDKNEGLVVYRIPGHRHGDGQVDSDATPVWLVAEDQDLAHYDSLDDITTN